MGGGMCRRCAAVKGHEGVSRRPPKDELERLLWSMPIVHIAERFGVSDVAVAKWCKFYGLKRPGRGYWAKVYAGKITNARGEKEA